MLVEEDSNENIFELQHHHLLRCLEKTTVKMIMLEKLLTKLLRIESLSTWIFRSTVFQELPSSLNFALD